MKSSVIKETLYEWVAGELGTSHVFSVELSQDFVSGNIINMDIGGVPIAQVVFDTDHDTTVRRLRQYIGDHESIFRCTNTALRKLICMGTGRQIITLANISVTGGASQPIFTVTTLENPVEVTVIFSDQDAPKPFPYPFATVRLINISKIGQEELRGVDQDDVFRSVGQRKLSVSVNFFGDDPMEEARSLFDSLGKESVQHKFRSVGFAVLDKGTIQNLTTMLETKFEPRSQFDLFLGYTEEIYDDLGIIEKVKLTGEHNYFVAGHATMIKKIIGPKTISS